MKNNVKKHTKVKNLSLGLLKIFFIMSIIVILVALTVGVTFAIYVDRKVEKTIDESLFVIV